MPLDFEGAKIIWHQILPVSALEIEGSQNQDPSQRRQVMKRIAAITLIALAGILGAGSAMAQSYQVQATMPFNFTVGNNVLPAGTYQIFKVSSYTVEIRNREKHVAILAMAFTDSNQSGNDGKLVFHRYAGQYFLREIRCESASIHMDLPPTKWEKRARVQEAQLRNDSRQVLIAAK
jgi:hypothetical protein